jgi:hypothetical protein
MMSVTGSGESHVGLYGIKIVVIATEFKFSTIL